MTYRVARYTNSTTIEERPGKFFWRRSAVKVAQDLNDATHKPTGITGFFQAIAGSPSPWEVFSVKALAYAHTLAEEKAWQAKDREARAQRLRNLMAEQQRPSVLDDVEAGHPATVPVRVLPWLDEDPTDAGTSWGVTEDQWDAANGGSLEGGKELPVRIPDVELPDPTADLPPEEAAKFWEGVTFLPVQETLLNREENAAADTTQIPSFGPEDAKNGTLVIPEEVQLSPAVEAFLADAPVTVKRPARRRSARTNVVDNDQDA